MRKYVDECVGEYLASTGEGEMDGADGWTVIRWYMTISVEGLLSSNYCHAQTPSL